MYISCCAPTELYCLQIECSVCKSFTRLQGICSFTSSSSSQYPGSTMNSNMLLWLTVFSDAVMLAAQEFDELKKAYAILSDKAARGALDDYLE